MRSWSRPAQRRAAATLLAAGVATSAVACGGSTSSGAATQSSSTTRHTFPGGSGSSASAGLKVFISAGCGSCHTLNAAHSTGTVGPNLDDLKPSEALVASQVSNGGAAMPSFGGRLSTAQIAAVAKFVASAAG